MAVVLSGFSPTASGSDPVGVCVDPRGCTPDAGSSNSSSDDAAEERGRRARAWADCKLFHKNCPATDDSARLQDAYNANQAGIEAQNRGDLVRAVALYEAAANMSPNDATIRSNLNNSRALLAQKQARDAEILASQRRAEAAAATMQRSLQDYAKTLDAPATGGLDFDGRSSAGVPASSGIAKPVGVKSSAPDSKPGCDKVLSGDTSVVDLRSGPCAPMPRGDSAVVDLSYAVDEAFKTSTPAVRQSVREGLDALRVGDWTAARIHFEVASAAEPGSATLKDFVVLTDYRVGHPHGAVTPAPPPAPAVHSAAVDKAEIDRFFADYRAGKKPVPSAVVRNYVLYLPIEDFRHLIYNLEPQESDMDYLFDLSTPRAPKKPASVSHAGPSP